MLNSTRTSSRQIRSGYVLLMTLLLLVIVAAAMTAACRTSLRLAVDADEAERSLQTRWAMTSCQQTLLPNCEKVLAAQERQTQKPVVSATRSLVLCGLSIGLVYSDESAKISAADLVSRLGASDAQIKLRSLLSGSGMTQRIHLRIGHFAVSSAGAASSSQPMALGSFGTVLDSPMPAELLRSNDGEASVADRISCWGDGHVNWRRASESTLRTCLVPPLTLSHVQQLRALQRRAAEGVATGLGSALDACGLNGAQRLAATDRLSDGSSCHSLWVCLHQGERICYRLLINKESGATSIPNGTPSGPAPGAPSGTSFVTPLGFEW